MQKYTQIIFTLERISKYGTPYYMDYTVILNGCLNEDEKRAALTCDCVIFHYWLANGTQKPPATSSLPQTLTLYFCPVARFLLSPKGLATLCAYRASYALYPVFSVYFKSNFPFAFSV